MLVNLAGRIDKDIDDDFRLRFAIDDDPDKRLLADIRWRSTAASGSVRLRVRTVEIRPRLSCTGKDAFGG